MAAGTVFINLNSPNQAAPHSDLSYLPDVNSLTISTYEPLLGYMHNQLFIYLVS